MVAGCNDLTCLLNELCPLLGILCPGLAEAESVDTHEVLSFGSWESFK